eukprot:NODE_8781_length_1470_cov_10.174981.p1 GENE.NODE_8781_length_1470_cov_10.174981~~NODE_8781_length_1470_cov_10.174981.p1  ORF type:complete len:458 (-),score=91.29 NODE_8781_length_1470_cov_10.174981:96-1418(-)
MVDNLGDAFCIGGKEQGNSVMEKPCPSIREHRPCMAKFADDLASLVESPWFEGSFAALIVCNAIIMCLQIQYVSFDLAASLSYTEDARSSRSTWPGAGKTFDAFGIMFGGLFSVEVLLKIVVLRRQFVKCAWNLFDALLVTIWIGDALLGDVVLVVNPMLLRVLRLLRLVRLSRMVKTFQGLDSLQVLIGSMSACVSVLFWAGCVLLFILVTMSMVLNAMLTPFMEVDGSGDLSLATRQQLFTYFGSWSRSMYSMFEVTFGNFIPVTRILMENVSEGYGAFLIIYRFVVGFSVVQVITGVFMHETFQVAASDDALMVVQKQRTMQKHATKMKLLMTRLDSSNDGVLDRLEFSRLLDDNQLKTWLSSMDVEVNDPLLLYDLVDNGDGQMTVDELTRGIARLRGPARSIDLAALNARAQDLRERLIRIEDTVYSELMFNIRL